MKVYHERLRYCELVSESPLFYQITNPDKAFVYDCWALKTEFCEPPEPKRKIKKTEEAK